MMPGSTTVAGRESRKGMGGQVVKGNKSSVVVYSKGNTDSMQD